ncbi:AMP-binding protein [Sinosporangium siamense]|nr:AMP-binding protein [Sinosporangium siamense]
MAKRTSEAEGVEVTHRAAANTVEDINDRCAAGPGDRVLAVSALDFDLSVYDIFGLLSAGGAVVTVDEANARRRATLAARHGVRIWNTVPKLLDMLLVVLESGGPGGPVRLRRALASGDWGGGFGRLGRAESAGQTGPCHTRMPAGGARRGDRGVDLVQRVRG